MKRHMPLVALASLTLAAGCGSSPSAPSNAPTVTTESAAATASQSAVNTSLTQAMGQVVALAPYGGSTPYTFTMPCAGGGSTVSTFSVGSVGGGVVNTSSRTEYRDCKMGTTTINGDPYLDSTNQHVYSGDGGPEFMSTSTMHITGGLRFDTNGIAGRSQFNCTMVITTQLLNGTTQSSFAWSGTTTWEQPLGSAPVTRSCGPSS